MSVPPSAPAPTGMSTTTKAVLIVAGSVLGSAILLGGLASALGANRAGTPVTEGAAVETTTPTPTPTPSPTPDVTPEAPAVDVAKFIATASRDLGDLEKDLDDMVRTLDEGGFWRLLSNSVEVSFNYGQLAAHTPPASVAEAYAAGLQNLDDAIATLTDSVTGDDTAAIRAAIENTRTQAAALRAVVDSAT